MALRASDSGTKIANCFQSMNSSNGITSQSDAITGMQPPRIAVNTRRVSSLSPRGHGQNVASNTCASA